MKSLSSIYLDAYSSVARKQHAKYGNPTAEAEPAPAHIPAVLEAAVRSGELTTEQARRLAGPLGHKAYGEVGLTPGVISGVFDKTLGFNALPWQVAGKLVAAISTH